MVAPRHEDDCRPDAKGPVGPLKELAVVAAVLAAVISVLVFGVLRFAGATKPGRSETGSPASLFAGSRACAECHPGESALYHRSGRSKTLRRAPESGLAAWLDGRAVRDEEYPDAVWSFSKRDESVAARRSENGREERSSVEYAFGSGRHATTFVSLTDRDVAHPTALEHRLTYFAQDRSLGITPGQSRGTDVDPEEVTPSGRRLGAEKTLECFGCHTTLLSQEGGRELDTATMIPNVTCERCHGPGQEHVAAARRGDNELRMPFGPGRYAADLQMRLCGQCHRHPDMAPAGTIRPDNLEIVRFQPVGLMQSKCYTRSRGALSCTTCHDPHAPASNDHASYEAACLSCHRARQQAVCPVSPSTGCISCHMPERDSGQKILFHDHWIRTNPATDASSRQ